MRTKSALDFHFIFDNGPDINIPGTNWCPVNTFYKFYHLLKKERPDINLIYINAAEQRTNFKGYEGPASLYGPFYLMIRNIHTGKYFLISYWDTIKDIFNSKGTHFDLNCLEELITSIGVVTNDVQFKKLPWLNYTPFGYVSYLTECEDILEKLQSSGIEKIVPEKPRFRNFPNDPFRQFLMEDKRFDCIDKRYNLLHIPEYMHELYTHKIGLSVNGHGEICHRDMEILGAGNVLLRTKFVVEFHEPLIPDYHYVAVEVDDFLDYQTIANKLIEKYNEIKDKPDFLNFVAKNGREWYLKNGCTDGNAKLLLKLLDFNKLT